MRLLVTGGTCRLAAEVSRLLLQEGHDVVLLAAHPPAEPGDLPDGARVEIADCADVTAVDLVVASTRPQGCIHLADLGAPQTDGGRSTRHLRVGVSAALTLIDRLVAHGCERIVVSSTATAWGAPGDERRTESPSPPVTSIGLIGVLIGQVLPWVQQVHGLRWAVLRSGEGTPATLDADVADRIVEGVARAHVDALEALASVERLIVDLDVAQGGRAPETIDCVGPSG